MSVMPTAATDYPDLVNRGAPRRRSALVGVPSSVGNMRRVFCVLERATQNDVRARRPQTTRFDFTSPATSGLRFLRAGRY